MPAGGRSRVGLEGMWEDLEERPGREESEEGRGEGVVKPSTLAVAACYDRRP